MSKEDYREKDWDERFEEWKKRKQQGEWKKHTTAHHAEEAVERVEQDIDRIEKEITEVEKNIEQYVKKTPGHVKVVKGLVVLIPVLIVVYLLSANFLVPRDFEYSYDIGAAGEKYLTPAERISQAGEIEGVTYRNLTGHLVYFDVPIARGAETVDIAIAFKDNFPVQNGRFSLGARDQVEWHYIYKRLYNPSLALGGYEQKDGIYRVNENLPVVDEIGLWNMDDITIASEDFQPRANVVAGYQKTDTVIDSALRGKHVFYVYAIQDLLVEVEKRDINWYEGSDELFIALYDFDGKLVEFTQIGDDGVKDASTVTGAVQKAALNANGLDEGVYRLELSDFDGLITKMKINSNKVVADKVFLADNEIYGVDTKPSTLYFDYKKDITLRVITYHKDGLQVIDFNRGGNVEKFDFNIEDEPVHKKLTKGSYSATFPKNDIIIESPEYFAFTPNGYFRPFRQKVVSVNSPDWVMDSVDYAIVDYVAPEVLGEWIIARTSFNIKNDSLYVTDKGMLSLVFNTPHLAEAGSNYTIPIDWIEVKVHKPGVFG